MINIFFPVSSKEKIFLPFKFDNGSGANKIIALLLSIPIFLKKLFFDILGFHLIKYSW
jgi:hypothetical protein